MYILALCHRKWAVTQRFFIEDSNGTSYEKRHIREKMKIVASDRAPGARMCQDTFFLHKRK